MIGKLISLLLKELNLTVQAMDEDTEKFLAAAWMTPGFRKYLGYREGRIVYHLAGGSNISDPGREAYIRHIGCRLEILALGVHAKKAYQRQLKKKAEQKETAPVVAQSPS